MSTLLGWLGDDNIDAVQMLAMFLKAAGDKVLVERESRRMVKRALTEMSKLYALGIGIPELDENELAQQLQLHQLTSKAVRIAQEGDRKRSMADRLDTHMVQPVDWSNMQSYSHQFNRRFVHDQCINCLLLSEFGSLEGSVHLRKLHYGN